MFGNILFIDLEMIFVFIWSVINWLIYLMWSFLFKIMILIGKCLIVLLFVVEIWVFKLFI